MTIKDSCVPGGQRLKAVTGGEKTIWKRDGWQAFGHMPTINCEEQWRVTSRESRVARKRKVAGGRALIPKTPLGGLPFAVFKGWVFLLSLF
jgi:hypothetical protein